MRLTLFFLLLLWPIAALPCGQTTDCRVGDGAYRIIKPDGPVKGTIIMLHGWQGSAAGLARSDRLARAANPKGLVMVYPNGRLRGWAVPNSPAEGLRDDFAFLRAVRDDLSTRHGLEPNRMVLAGFSMGGQMAWNIACARGSDFAAYIAISGALWDPVPTECANPAKIVLHIHGTKDVTVPLEGATYGTDHRMAPVEASLALRHKGCGMSERFKADQLTCRRWSCNGITEQCLHGGGHVFYVQPLFRAFERIAVLKGWK